MTPIDVSRQDNIFVRDLPYYLVDRICAALASVTELAPKVPLLFIEATIVSYKQYGSAFAFALDIDCVIDDEFRGSYFLSRPVGPTHEFADAIVVVDGTRSKVLQFSEDYIRFYSFSQSGKSVVVNGTTPRYGYGGETDMSYRRVYSL